MLRRGTSASFPRAGSGRTGVACTCHIRATTESRGLNLCSLCTPEKCFRVQGLGGHSNPETQFSPNPKTSQHILKTPPPPPPPNLEAPKTLKILKLSWPPNPKPKTLQAFKTPNMQKEAPRRASASAPRARPAEPSANRPPPAQGSEARSAWPSEGSVIGASGHVLGFCYYSLQGFFWGLKAYIGLSYIRRM